MDVVLGTKYEELEKGLKDACNEFVDLKWWQKLLRTRKFNQKYDDLLKNCRKCSGYIEFSSGTLLTQMGKEKLVSMIDIILIFMEKYA